MDFGAHFHKCDFQVHTPRDLNWDGAGAVTKEERRAYADEFVGACRAKELQAVAITDHHDIEFFQYIREAAQNETDATGKPIAEADRLVVFPGMELTLGIPCQALVLFDADLPLEFLPLALPALGITPSASSEPKHADIKKLDIMSFADLYDALQKVDPLKGRFIVFPHVKDGGHQSLLRQGFEKHYVSMPCVGGYVDGSLPGDPKAKGMRSITAGLDKNYGNKAIGLFQTSDARSRDFSKLGSSVTWVKWAHPTAEALRQACLARHSRIAHSEPRLPAVQITRIEVTNSKFLGPITLDLNPQYNAIIGGRGTGKSTVLEYVRWALCDQPPTTLDGDGGEVADFQRRRQSLIEGTLLPLDAVVDVSFLLNEVPHVVRRKASGDLTLKIGAAGFEACTEQNVRELLPVRAYSQKQLSAVGARLDELRRFVHAPIQAELDALEEQIGTLRVDLRSHFDQVVRYRVLQAEVAAHDIERRSITEQIERLRSSLKGLSDDDRKIIARQASYETEQRVVQTLERDANATKDALNALAADLSRVPTVTPDERNTKENTNLVKEIHGSLAEWVSTARVAVSALQDAFVEPLADKPLSRYFAAVSEWRRRRDEHRRQYEEAKARAAAHEETLKQIQTLEARLAEINELADQKTQQITKLGDPLGRFDAVRASWKVTHRKRGDLLEKQCQELTAVSKRLRATLKRAADTAPLDERLRKLTKGTKTRGERIDSLVAQIATAADPLDVWHGLLEEFLGLAWLHVEDEAATVLPASPRLDSAGFTQKEKLALARQLDPAGWLELFLFDLKDLPVFEYQVRANDFLPFEKASPGQQATALLSILLLQDGPPLLIDQPEDDLNMKIINEIVETLWQAKAHRQIVFASHNANLVVNGDAELVVCSDYRTSGTESGGQVKLTGAIDVPAINREIAEVMEGGLEAFKLRKEKYGF